MASQKKKTTDGEEVHLYDNCFFLSVGEVCPLCSFLGLFTQGDAELCEMQIIIK